MSFYICAVFTKCLFELHMGGQGWKVWWHKFVILTLSRPKQEDGEFKASLSYIVRPCLKKKKSWEQ
jgi:hypothetical protein